MVNAFIQERELFPPAMPFRSGSLQRDKHEIYYEQCGNLDGQPLLFLHGGPGAGIAPAHRRLFDPKRFHGNFEIKPSKSVSEVEASNRCS